MYVRSIPNTQETISLTLMFEISNYMFQIYHLSPNALAKGH